MSRTKVAWAVTLVTGACAAALPAAPSGDDAAASLPQVSLGDLPGLDEDRDYALSMARQAAELAEQAAQSVDPVTRIDLLLNAANVILAREIEPICTMRLLRIEASHRQDQHAATENALDRADGFLGEVAHLLDQRGDEPSGESPAAQARTPKVRCEVLQAFSAALRAFLLSGDEPEAVREARMAASRLSVLLEEDDRQIAAAAGLWQACLRSLDSDPSRALALLDPALAGLPQHSLPFSLFARLLRIRLIAAQGNYAAALALLTQMEELCPDWLADEGQRGRGLRTMALLRVEILLDWQAALTDPNQADERQWCSDQVKRIVAEHFTEQQRSVLRLDPCVPVLNAPPTAGDYNSGASKDDD